MARSKHCPNSVVTLPGGGAALGKALLLPIKGGISLVSAVFIPKRGGGHKTRYVQWTAKK